MKMSPSPIARMSPVARWHGVSRIDEATGMVLLSLRLGSDDAILRFRIPASDLWTICEALAFNLNAGEDAQETYRRLKNAHSERSSGSPSSDGSTVPGQSVRPPTSSSSAASGEE